MKIKMFKIKKPKSIDPSIIERAKQQKTIMSIYSFCCLNAIINFQKISSRSTPLLYISVFILSNSIIDLFFEKKICWTNCIIAIIVFSIYLFLIIKKDYKYFLNKELEYFQQVEEKLYKSSVKNEINNIINDIEEE